MQHINKYFENVVDTYKKVDTKFSKERTTKWIFALLILFFGTLILGLNLIYPLYADDWAYSFMQGLASDQVNLRISSVLDVFRSQYNHYFNWGGRSVVHFIAQCLLLTKGYWADILNTVAYIFFAYIIYRICNSNKKTNPSLFFIINILIWFFQPAFAETILWITGSANYLWGTLIIITFLSFFSQSFIKEDNTNSIYKSVFIFLFGIIAGWTNENTALGMISIIFLLIGYLKLTHQKIPTWMIIGLAGAILGFIIMITAPGNYIRYESAIEGNELIQQSKIKYYQTRLFPVIVRFYKYVGLLVVFYLLTLVTYLYFEKKRNYRVIFLSISFLVAGIVSDLAMVASPTFPLRAWFGIITFFIIGVGILYANLTSKQVYLSVIKSLLVFFTSIHFLFTYEKAYEELYVINQIYEKREQIIEEQPDKANFDFVTHESINPQTNFSMIMEISSEEDNWLNRLYVKYHGIKSFKIETNTPTSESDK